jgi:hypothetical protein
VLDASGAAEYVTQESSQDLYQNQNKMHFTIIPAKITTPLKPMSVIKQVTLLVILAEPTVKIGQPQKYSVMKRKNESLFPESAH